MHHCLAGILPAQDAAAVGQAEQGLVTGLDLVLVIVAKVGGAGAPGAFVVCQAQLFVDAGFRVEVGVAQQVAAAFVDLAGVAATTTAVEQVVGVGLVQVRGLVGAGDTALDAQGLGDLVRGVEARAPVAAEVLVMVVAQAGGDDGVGADFDVVFGVQGKAACSGFGLGTVEAWQFGARVIALRAQRAWVVERFVKVFATQGQHLLKAHTQRQVDLASGAGVAQARFKASGTA
ncbi:hypothetical protein D3C78_556220 [compost metagenome]